MMFAFVAAAMMMFVACCCVLFSNKSLHHVDIERSIHQQHPHHRHLRTQDNNITNHYQYNRSLMINIQLERTTYKIPHTLDQNLIDWTDIPTKQGGEKDGLPIFWHILKSGGTTIKLMYAQCYHLVEACETGVLENVWQSNGNNMNNNAVVLEDYQNHQQQFEQEEQSDQYQQQQEAQQQQQPQQFDNDEQSSQQQLQDMAGNNGQQFEQQQQQQQHQQLQLNNGIPDPLEWMQQQQQVQQQPILPMNDNNTRRRLQQNPAGLDLYAPAGGERDYVQTPPVQQEYGTAGFAVNTAQLGGDDVYGEEQQQQAPPAYDTQQTTQEFAQGSGEVVYAPVQQEYGTAGFTENNAQSAPQAQPAYDSTQEIQEGGGLLGSILSVPDHNQQNDGSDDDLRVVISEDGRKYVNVDVTTPEGIIKASQLGFATSNLADVVFTPLLLESSELLLNKNTNMGRMFAVFRHPIDRVVSIFYYLQSATWEPTYNPQYAAWTIDEFARSPYCESNWMVRSLTNKMEGPLSPDDIEIAKEVLRRKCLVGLMERMEESIVRFHTYFGFGDEVALLCSQQTFASKGSSKSNSHSHPKLDEQSETYEILRVKNELDIRLYEYAKELFEEQGKLLHG